MFDRYIGIFGLILGIISLVAPYRWSSIPSIYTSIGLYAAMLLIGLAIGMALPYGNANEKPNDVAKNVGLFLQFSDAHSIPKEIRQNNVLSWYALFTESIYVKTQSENREDLGGFSVPPRWTIFLMFDKPTSYRQMVATCSGPENLHCTVQNSNDRYAIVTAVGDVTGATLDISTI